MSNPPPGYPRVSPYLLYEDAEVAIDYLQRTFGFELRLTQIGRQGDHTTSFFSGKMDW
jgi:uncharacterized glyoxalase superfamily protein PhnB